MQSFSLVAGAASHIYTILMRRHISSVLYLFVLLYSSIIAHPANGVIEDQNGNVFFADVGKNIIWKIDTAGKTTEYITGVHSHDFWLDSLNQLHGEHLEYNSGEQTFYYSYWIKPSNDTLRWEHPPIKNDQRPLVYDKKGNGYMWRGNNNTRDHSELWQLTSRGDWKKLCGSKYGHADGDSATALLDAVGDLFVTDSGDLYLTDLRSIRLWKDGKLTTLYRETDTTGLLKNSSLFGIYVTENGPILSTNYGNQNVLIWSHSSVLTELYPSDSTWSPTGVTMRANGNVLILEGSYETDDHLKVRVIELSESGAKRVLGGN